VTRFSKCVIVICLSLLPALCRGADTSTVSVQVRTGELRTAPSFLAAVVATLSYGDRVPVLEQQGAWCRARTPDGSAEGWIHSSALTRKKVVLQAGEDVGAAASSGEIALAGKGFSSDVESAYRKENRNLNYAWVDKMEAVRIPEKRLAAFLKEGGLAPKGGAK
jgi:hypothetical protein